MSFKSFVLLSVLFVGCIQTTQPVVPVSSDACDAAEKKINELSCTTYMTKPKTFAMACKEALADKRDWRPDCIARVTACDQVSVAYRTPAGKACAQ